MKKHICDSSLKLKFLFLFLLINSIAFCQIEFSVDTIYLKNKNITMIAPGYLGEIWCLEETVLGQNIYRITSNGEVINKTSEFQAQINNGLTDIICVDTNAVVVGTKSDFAYYYKSGKFIKYDANFGINASSNAVNSLYFAEDRIDYYGEEKTKNTNILIATNGDTYQASNLTGYFLPFRNGTVSKNNKFYCKDDYLMLHKDIDGGKSMLYINVASYMMIGNYLSSNWGDVLCANIQRVYTSTYDIVIGTENGIETLYTGSGSGRYQFLLTQSIYSVIDYYDYFLIAAELGLYFQYRINEEPQKIELNIGNYTPVAIRHTDNNIYVATNIGLLKLTETSCNKYKTFFKQSCKYQDINQKDSIKFFGSNQMGSSSFTWNFGDGRRDTSQSVKHFFKQPGNYTISLTSKSKLCTDSLKSYITAFDGTKISKTAHKYFDLMPNLEQSRDYSCFGYVDLDGDLIEEFVLDYKGVFTINATSDTIELKQQDVIFSVTGNWADLNNDGLNDVINYNNKGDLNFLNTPYPWEYSSNYLLDINNDSYTDFVILKSGIPEFYINNGNLTYKTQHFNDINLDSVMAIRCFDINNDNSNDLIYIRSNDIIIFYKSDTNYIKDPHNLRFNEYIGSYAFGDLNNDLLLDLCVSTADSNYIFTYKNNKFNQLSSSWVVNDYSTFYSGNTTYFYDATLADVDNNGYQDLIKLSTVDTRLFMNQGDLIFVNDTSNNVTKHYSTRGVSLMDLDVNDDGKIDFLIGDEAYGEGIALYLNEGPSDNKFIRFNCFGTKSNINAIGAKVIVKATQINGNKLNQVHQIEAIKNQNYQNEFTMHFGMSDATAVDSVIVYWPSGIKSVYLNLQTNKTYNIIEPWYRFKEDTVICENEFLLFTMPPVPNVSYQWYLNKESLNVDTSKLKVNIAGQYSCIVNNGYWIDTFPEIKVIVNPVTKANFAYNNSTPEFCPSDSLLFKSEYNETYSYIWKMGGGTYAIDTSQIFIKKAPLTLMQILINNFGCKDTTEAVKISYYPVPKANLPDTVEFCATDSVFISSAQSQSYLWSTGDTTHGIYAHQQNMYQLKIWNDLGCANKDSCMTLERKLPKFDIGPKDTTILFTSEFIPVHECNFNNKYLWYDGASNCSRIFRARDLDYGLNKIWLTVINEYTCCASDTLTIQVSSEVPESGLPFIYPNPLQGYLNIIIDHSMINKDISFQIYDLYGHLILEKGTRFITSEIFSYDVSTLKSGLYVLKTTWDKTSTKKKFLVL